MLCVWGGGGVGGMRFDQITILILSIWTDSFDQTLDAASDQVLHCLPLVQQILDKHDNQN